MTRRVMLTIVRLRHWLRKLLMSFRQGQVLTATVADAQATVNAVKENSAVAAANKKAGRKKFRA
jgi:hypothetical protein